MLRHCVILVVIATQTLTGIAAEEPTAAERGRKALLEQAYVPSNWSQAAYKNAWRQWGDGRKSAPDAYDDAFREHYGLHPAPYPNNGLPMGLRETSGIFSKGVTSDCMCCHGGSILGQSCVGLPNSTLDIQALFEDLAAADGKPSRMPFVFGAVRGTTEAGTMAVYLLGWRDPQLNLRAWQDLGMHENLCEDAPAWWLLKKKKTMYHTGSGDARSVRSLMPFMLTPLNPPGRFDQAEPAFRDIQAYLLSLQPPRFPLPVDTRLAEKGRGLFTENCSRCHGTYGPEWTYPNKIVPIDTIGTDRTRLIGITEVFAKSYNHSWFGKERPGWLADEFPSRTGNGYQAPPLDGIWATAPYFHNGSVPTVYHVLNSAARPRIFTRSFRTDHDAYDPVRLGWKTQILDQPADGNLPLFERRRIYDTSLPGRGNGGHTFGDHLTDEERFAVIEYLKTL